jgi:hypothetical protein
MYKNLFIALALLHLATLPWVAAFHGVRVRRRAARVGYEDGARRSIGETLRKPGERNSAQVLYDSPDAMTELIVSGSRGLVFVAGCVVPYVVFNQIVAPSLGLVDKNATKPNMDDIMF